MCDMGISAMILTGLATGLSAYGQLQQGKYQSQVARNNAIVQNRMAEDAIERGQREEARHRMKVGLIKGQQRAQIGASGREFSGSAIDILNDTTVMGELDAFTIRDNAEREAYGFRVGATNSLAQGKLDRMRGNYGAGGTLLTGASKVAGQYKTYYGT